MNDDRLPARLRDARPLPAPARQAGARPAPAPRPAPAARHDGFTPARQRALAATASVADAAREAGVSRNTVYRRRAEPDAEAFRLAWAAALAQAFDRLADTAFDRAVNGVEQPVFWRGEQVGTRTWYNDRLLMFLLRRREQFSPTSETWEAGSVHIAPLYPVEVLGKALDLVAPAAAAGLPAAPEGAVETAREPAGVTPPFASPSSLSGA